MEAKEIANKECFLFDKEVTKEAIIDAFFRYLDTKIS